MILEEEKKKLSSTPWGWKCEMFVDGIWHFQNNKKIKKSSLSLEFYSLQSFVDFLKESNKKW